MDFGKNIGDLRRDKGLTQEELANAIGVATSSIQNYELNKRKPNYETLNMIAQILEVSIDELINGQSSAYINKLNREGATIKRDLSELSTWQLITELNSREDFPIKIEIKK
ncbi:hypothetical protein CBE01nite_43190 [Clostridium beijerinckii]|uniref:Helix-turn-helix transcriptional regulator n=1 Tax=Clostridium beijerinckii TaxID=1520 RepID=A0AB74VGX7_CLOBE|nr:MULTISPECIES: helix-turn-helix transcriptional regulator [Clostridium]NRZ24826.1 transcriptional regulator with XRE-family HTH domain [Clostridium beijerinckii]NYB98960.1 transcriptional regulator with XRE-family HTH domain [Clostridium beijerinckii]OOM24976.1 HTH-type transcriptional regulator Xre [Clostridium beijerinckii]QUN35632.1 helix-turn-helix transcriptional regulator [Clostridium beijerinckii]SQB22008.1 phage transcriptional regulator [Clostridium beijerinckii]